uniref:Copia protein n=1 Tax=Lygus hesperus TaxID=30085 RepID=A0A0A9YB70_LYGHE
MAALSTGCLPSEIPNSFEEAIEMKGWKDAIQVELNNLERNETWEVIPKSAMPVNQKLIDTRWIFTMKDQDGQDLKKARLVARGFQQQISIEEDIYAPVARMTTLRILLSLAVDLDLRIHQMDVKAAFLKGVLKEPVYIKVPEGVNCDRDRMVCKLTKSLYGLKNAPKSWNDVLNSELLQLSFERCLVDPCLYFMKNACTYLLVWVDDILLFSNNDKEADSIKNALKEVFDIKELNKNHNKFKFLGINIEIKNGELYLSQQDLICKVLNQFEMNTCKISQIPMEPRLNLSVDERDENYKVPYKELIGSLMYIMLGTRPDLCYSITFFSQFQNCYNLSHWKHLKNVLRYLKGTVNLSLKYSKSVHCNEFIIKSYADSDFASNVNDRKSISGYIVKLNENTVSWKSKKQNVVALSTAEAEYVSLSTCITEVLFLKQLIESILKIKLTNVVAYEDNQTCIKMAKTMETKRSKHIDVRHHFIRELIEKGVLKLLYLPTDEQIADIMTKSLSLPKFSYFRSQIGMI